MVKEKVAASITKQRLAKTSICQEADADLLDNFLKHRNNWVSQNTFRQVIFQAQASGT